MKNNAMRQYEVMSIDLNEKKKNFAELIDQFQFCLFCVIGCE
jgi:hypothetical protein